MRDAAGQRHHPDERQRRNDSQQRSMLGQERAASCFAVQSCLDEVGSSGREEVPVALLDDPRQRGAAAQRREDLTGGLRRPDERLAQLRECQRVSNSEA